MIAAPLVLFDDETATFSRAKTGEALLVLGRMVFEVKVAGRWGVNQAFYDLISLTRTIAPFGASLTNSRPLI
jgi:hypothetical protein